MGISIISASTGNGHNAVMRALTEEFEKSDYVVKCYPTFFEDLLLSNAIQTDFYNFLSGISFDLCKKYNELIVLESEKRQDQMYGYCYDSIDKFIKSDTHEVIISTTPLVNRMMIRYLKENNLIDKIPFYIVVTDPYDPIYPGFDIVGATKYFCPNYIVKDILLKSGIQESKINVFGYPISRKFNNSLSESEKEKIYYKYGLNSKQPTLLINSGSQGSSHYFSFLKSILENNKLNIQIIFISGNNNVLYKAVSLYCKSNNIKNVAILPFVDNMEEILSISDACITKAGANTIYENILNKTPVIVDSTYGFLYQERGIKSFIERYKIGYCFENMDELNKVLDILYCENGIYSIKNNIEMINAESGSKKIIESIISDL